MNRPLRQRPTRWFCYPWKVQSRWCIGFGPGGVRPQILFSGTYQSRGGAVTAAEHINRCFLMYNSHAVDLEEETTERRCLFEG